MTQARAAAKENTSDEGYSILINDHDSDDDEDEDDNGNDDTVS